MLLITDLDDAPDFNNPCGLTIGSFDGVHLGHQALISHLRSELPSNGILTVFTFSNHPSQNFTPHAPVPLISPPLQKVKYLGEIGVDIVVLIPFTTQFSQTPFDQFLSRLKERLEFSYLALGAGATFGKGKEGNEANVKRLAPELGFKVDYLPKFLLDGIPVSSGRIRTLISQGEFSKAQACLGRPYSLMGHIQDHEMNATNLCLPPEGTYSVSLKIADQIHLGSAEVSPVEQKIRLDFLNKSLKINHQEVEIFFA